MKIREMSIDLIELEVGSYNPIKIEVCKNHIGMGLC